MNSAEKKFLVKSLQQLETLKNDLRSNKIAQEKVDEKYRLLAEQEKKELKEEEESLAKMITLLDTNGITIFGKPLSELEGTGFGDEFGIERILNNPNDDLEEVRKIKEMLGTPCDNSSTDDDKEVVDLPEEPSDYDVDKVPAPSTESDDDEPELFDDNDTDTEPEEVEEVENADEVEDDEFADLDEWPDIDEDFNS